MMVTFTGYVYRSSDSGATWTNVSTITLTGACVQISMSGDGTTVFVVENAGFIWASYDSGSTFANALTVNGLPQGIDAYRSVCVSSNGAYVTVGVEGTPVVFRSEDAGASFTSSSTPSLATSPFTINMAPRL